jgi:hypothetical protein
MLDRFLDLAFRLSCTIVDFANFLPFIIISLDIAIAKQYNIAYDTP